MSKRAAFGRERPSANMLEFYGLHHLQASSRFQIGHTFFPAQSEYGSLMLSLADLRRADFVTRRSACIVLRHLFRSASGGGPACCELCDDGRKPFLVLSLRPVLQHDRACGAAHRDHPRVMVQGLRWARSRADHGLSIEIAPPERRGLVVSWQKPTSPGDRGHDRRAGPALS